MVKNLHELIERGEDSFLQLKVRFDSVDQLAAELCAFSNSEGGKILVGVSDHGDIVGLDQQQLQKLNQDISSACSQKIDPPISVTTKNVMSGDKLVVVIEVPRGANKFYMANGRDVWVKVGADKRRASREEIQRLLQESANLFADEGAVDGTSLADLDLREFRELYERRIKESFDESSTPVETLLENMKLMVNGKCTLAGLLLLGKKPQYKRPSYVVKAVSYVGSDPAGSEYKDSRDIEGTIPQMFKASIAFLTNNLRMLQKDQDFNSIGILEIPRVALEEAVMNALVHRNYYIASNIRIFMFDDRVEIRSPGKLPNTLTVESIQYGIHIERNPIIVSLLRDFEGIPYRGIGTGIQRIQRECEESGIKVEFHNLEKEEQFHVIFYRP
jgi:predicted HTH transcriptional regulator